MNPNAKRIDADFIVTEYGNLYQKRGQGMDRIKRALIQKAETLEKYARHKTTDDDIYEMGTDIFQPVLQPFRIPFEPQGGVKFVPNKITLQRMKIDLPFYPDEIVDNWLGFLANIAEADRTKWPITKYMIEVYLKQQIDYDREMNAVYKGVHNADGHSASDCMDGIKVKLKEGANNGQNPINIITGVGQLSESTCFDQVEAFSKKIKSIYRMRPIIICVAPEFERAFLENKRSNGFYFINGPEQINNKVDFTKQIVMGLPSMSDTKDMFAFTDGNLLWLTRGDKFSFDIQKQDRAVKLLGDWKEGIGFAVNKEVWATEETVTESNNSGSGNNGGESNNETEETPVVVNTVTAAVDDADDITSSGATISGTVTGDTTGATVKFVYGKTPAFGNEATATLSEGVYTAELTGLDANTEYHYRLEVNTGENTVYSETKTFTTEE